MPIETVNSLGKVLARMIPHNEWHEGLTFYSNDQDSLQVGTWHYAAGKTLGPHTHNEVKREISRTCEVLFVFSGRVKAIIYDHGIQVKELLLTRGDTLILLEGGHGYEVLEDGTKVLEIKNGPYLGPDIDRRLITVVDSQP